MRWQCVTFGVDGTREGDGMFIRGHFFLEIFQMIKTIFCTLILILLLGWIYKVFRFQLINLNVKPPNTLQQFWA